MIEDDWRRVAGLHVIPDGTIAAAWLAHDRDADVVHLYDCALFKREVPAVIAEGINARGRWIPMAWPKAAKELADELTERGCNMEPNSTLATDLMAEMQSRLIWERMRTGRFKVDKRLGDWLDEYKSFYRQDAKIPTDSHPLMAATRHAIANLDFARRRRPARGTGVNYPKINVT